MKNEKCCVLCWCILSFLKGTYPRPPRPIDSRNIQQKNPQNVDVQKNSTQVLPRGFEDFWNLGNETSDSEISFRGSWVHWRNVDVWGFEDLRIFRVYVSYVTSLSLKFELPASNCAISPVYLCSDRHILQNSRCSQWKGTILFWLIIFPSWWILREIYWMMRFYLEFAWGLEAFFLHLLSALWN